MTEEEVERLIKELRGGSVPNLSIGGGWIVVKKEHLYPKDIFEYLLDTGEVVRGDRILSLYTLKGRLLRDEYIYKGIGVFHGGPFYD
jgi:hypothetical protein